MKQHMVMNSALLDSPCQRASSEPKKNYLAFSILEEIAKKQKIIFHATRQTNGVYDRKFPYT
jgi:hypothetical protein